MQELGAFSDGQQTIGDKLLALGVYAHEVLRRSIRRSFKR
jgi:hypothetical protein